MIFRTSTLNMSISGNVSGVGNTLRIEVMSNGAVVIPINYNEIINASKLSSSWAWAHFALYHTTHNRANYAACKICHDSKDNDGTASAKNHSDYVVAHGLKRSTSKLANSFMHSFCPSYSCKLLVFVVNC